MTKPKQSGSLNYKVCVWSFHTVHNPALKVGEQRCTFKVSPKVLVLVPQVQVLYPKVQGIGAAITRVQACTASLSSF